MKPSLQTLFGGQLQGEGGRYFQQTGGAAARSAPLAGEADVMMISGIGNPEAVTPSPVAAGANIGTVGSPAIPPPTLSGQLGTPITIGTITLPLWQWLVVAALLGGAGGYYFGRR